MALRKAIGGKFETAKKLELSLKELTKTAPTVAPTRTSISFKSSYRQQANKRRSLRISEARLEGNWPGVLNFSRKVGDD